MTAAIPDSDRELVLTRFVAAPPARLFEAWTRPELIVQWFTPAPWKTVHAETDVRAGGSSYIVMRGPDDTEMPNRGVYLEVVENKRLVFTDAFTEAWTPSGKPFMTGILTFDEEAGGTRYTARVLHWTAADCAAHKQMGFHEGWGKATEQLAELLGVAAPTA